jgi:hypothetical protein
VVLESTARDILIPENVLIDIYRNHLLSKKESKVVAIVNECVVTPTLARKRMEEVLDDPNKIKKLFIPNRR